MRAYALSLVQSGQSPLAYPYGHTEHTVVTHPNSELPFILSDCKVQLLSGSDVGAKHLQMNQNVKQTLIRNHTYDHSLICRTVRGWKQGVPHMPSKQVSLLGSLHSLPHEPQFLHTRKFVLLLILWAHINSPVRQHNVTTCLNHTSATCTCTLHARGSLRIQRISAEQVVQCHWLYYSLVFDNYSVSRTWTHRQSAQRSMADAGLS